MVIGRELCHSLSPELLLSVSNREPFSASHTTVILPGPLIIEGPASQNLMVPSAVTVYSARTSAACETDAWAYRVDPHSFRGESSPNIGSLQATHMEPFVYH